MPLAPTFEQVGAAMVALRTMVADVAPPAAAGDDAPVGPLAHNPQAVADTVARVEHAIRAMPTAVVLDLLSDEHLSVGATLAALATNVPGYPVVFNAAVAAIKASISAVADAPERDTVLLPLASRLIDAIEVCTSRRAAMTGAGADADSSTPALITQAPHRGSAASSRSSSVAHKERAPSASSRRGSGTHTPASVPPASASTGYSSVSLGCAEALLSCVHLAATCAPIVTVEHVSLLTNSIGRATGHPLVVYYGLATLHKLAVSPPRAAHIAVLAESNTHAMLLDVLQSSPASGWHATPRGIALHILAMMAEAQPALMTPLLSSTFVAQCIVPQLNSEWSEVLEGAMLWVAALVKHASATAFFDALLSTHRLHTVLAAACGAPAMRVAAAAATALRAVVQHAPSALHVPALVLGDSATLRTMLTMLVDAVNPRDEHGHRVAKAQTAAALCLCLARGSHKLRDDFSMLVERCGFDVPRVYRDTRALVAGMHPDMFIGCRIVDGEGRALSAQAALQLDPMEALPTAATARRLFETTALWHTEANEPDTAVTAEMASADALDAAITARAVLVGALMVGCRTHREHSTHSRGAAQAQPTAQPPLAPHRAAQTTPGDDAYKLAFQLAIVFSTNYRLNQDDAAATTSPTGAAAANASFSRHTDPAAAAAANNTTLHVSGGVLTRAPRASNFGVAASKNPWAPPERKAEQRRTWAAADVQRGDLFLFALPWSRSDPDGNATALKKTLRSAKAHMVHLHDDLQKQPIANVRRRVLLNDLYANVMPRVVACLEYLRDEMAGGGRAHATAAAQRVGDLLATSMSPSRQRAVMAGVDRSAAAAAVAAENELHPGNLQQVCAGLASFR